MKDKKRKKKNIRWMLVMYDLLVFIMASIMLLALYGGNDKLSYAGMMQQAGLSLVCIFAARLIGNVYGQIWRYGGIQCYIRLLFTDAVAFLCYLTLEMLMPIEKDYICKIVESKLLELTWRIDIANDVSICI